MNTTIEIIQDWAYSVESLALEYWESNSDQDSTEYAQECADGCQWTIYYSYAWDLVSAARLVCPKELDQAESELEEIGFEFESLDKTMTLLAYQLTYNEILNQIQKQESEQ